MEPFIATAVKASNPMYSYMFFIYLCRVKSFYCAELIKHYAIRAYEGADV
jgi:hypothetical protein